MANWSNPQLTSTYTNFLAEVKDRDVDLALQFDGTTSTNIPANAIRWDSSANRWKKWSGSVWGELTATYALTALSLTGSITFEGATDDAYETTLTVVDPTADRTITLPNVTGTVVTTGDSGSVTSTMIADGTIVNGDVNASAAIAGSKISPDFGSQNTTTTGTSTAASFIPTGATVPSNGIYLPAANQIGIATNSTQWVRITSTGDVNIKGAGTAGSTQAVSFSGSAPVDSLVVTSAGRVGLGTPSPQQVLHVLTSGSNSGAIQLGSSTYYGIIEHEAGAAGANIYTVASASGGGHIFKRGSTELMRLDASGNLGLGVTPSAWGSTALQISNAGGLQNMSGNQLALRGNCYYSSGDKFLRASGKATTFALDDLSGFLWYISTNTSSAADSSVTFTQAMTLDASGRLLVGATSDSGGALLQVNGDRVRIATAKTPASATATGTTGEVCWDANYVYVCTATNTWKRAAIATW